jgi:hypothetical protein
MIIQISAVSFTFKIDFIEGFWTCSYLKDTWNSWKNSSIRPLLKWVKLFRTIFSYTNCQFMQYGYFVWGFLFRGPAACLHLCSWNQRSSSAVSPEESISTAKPYRLRHCAYFLSDWSEVKILITTVCAYIRPHFQYLSCKELILNRNPPQNCARIRDPTVSPSRRSIWSEIQILRKATTTTTTTTN